MTCFRKILLGTALAITAFASCTFAASTFAASPAQATAPTEAQVDRLIDTMDMRRMLDEMFVQMDAMSDSMGQQMLGEQATQQQRDSLRDITSRQRASTRKALSWEKVAPIYRKVYMTLFTAEEIEAMTAFYGSDMGRTLMRKMPQAMQLSMQEMQPIMQTMIEDMRKSMETELESVGKAVD